MLELARRSNAEPLLPGGNRAGEYLAALEQKVLWLACWMIHHANHVRESRDGLKVGGHQASCASVATLITALYFDVLRPGDRVAVKPHASPMYHAIQYLLGRQTRDKLERFRAFGGAQAYPSRTKDTDGVDFSTGSVGLGCGDDALCLADPGPPARAAPSAGGPAQGAHGRDRGRCRARRGQRLRGPARGLEARRQERLVGDRLQPPEPRSGRAGAAVQEDRGLLRRGRLAGRDAEVRQAARGGLRAPGRPDAPPVDRRLPERSLCGDHLQGRQRLAPASRARSRPSRGHPGTARGAGR